MPSGVRCQSSYSSCLDYGLLLIYLTGKFSYLLIAIGLASGGEGTLVKKKTINKRVTDIDVVNEYRNLFLSLLSVYASVFNEAGVPFWKLHISVKLKFQLLAWWKKLSFVRRPWYVKSLNAREYLVKVKSTFYHLLVSIVVVVLFLS